MIDAPLILNFVILVKVFDYCFLPYPYNNAKKISTDLILSGMFDADGSRSTVGKLVENMYLLSEVWFTKRQFHT